jgi:hypothetical protein
MTLAPQLDPKTGTFRDVLYYLATEGDPSLYAKSFDRLVSWTDNSLDQYQVNHSLVQRAMADQRTASLQHLHKQ